MVLFNKIILGILQLGTYLMTKASQMSYMVKIQQDLHQMSLTWVVLLYQMQTFHQLAQNFILIPEFGNPCLKPRINSSKSESVMAV